ncbi:MAG: hypothetical protein AAF456_13695 [Planctomycetota bacterium]
MSFSPFVSAARGRLTAICLAGSRLIVDRRGSAITPEAKVHYMEIDIYQQCPCQNGKKIKFCCGKDVVDDLNQILQKNAAGQHDAAITKLESAMEKSGPRDCLLTLKTHILITTGKLAEARESNALYLQNNPGHPTGLQHQALIELGEGNLAPAISLLQDAMEALTGDTIPSSVANAFRIFAVGLATQGNVLSARAHVNFAGSLKPNDEQLKQILFETYRIPELPMVLKRSYVLLPAADDQKDEEWAQKYQSIFRVMERGQFRKALKGLRKIDQMAPGRPEIEWGLALLHSILHNRDEMAAAWHRYAANELVDHWDRVEAEALAQLLEVESAAGTAEIVRLTFDVDRMDEAAEVAVNSDRLIESPHIAQDVFGEGPAPRAAYFFLDKPEVADAESLTPENVPCVVGEVMFYGKQTDREARIECVAPRNGSIEAVKSTVTEMFGEFITAAPTESVLGAADLAGLALTWNWHLPKAVNRKQHSEMVEAYRRKSVLEEWSHLKFAMLDGKSPREAAGDASLKVALDALLLNLEQSADSQIAGKPITQTLREELDITRLPEVPGESVEDNVNPISPIRQQYLNFETLTDMQLLRVHSESIAIANIVALRKIVPQLIERESLHAQVPLDVSYSMLAELTEDDDTAMELLSKARSIAKERGQPIGGLLVLEFEQRLSRGMTEKLSPLLQRIQRYHMSEPNVEMHLARVLHRFGLIDEQGRPRELPASEASAGDDAPGLWTPDGGSPEEEKQEGSGLWLPDS